MPAPYCAVCGSVDVVIDESGLFVCNDCGAKITIEAMRNLMNQQQGGLSSDDAHPETVGEQAPLYGSEDADLVVSHYESGAYDLAAEAYGRIEDKKGLHPWVDVLGSLSEELADPNKSFYGTAMSLLPMWCKEYGLDPVEEGKLCLMTLLACTRAGSRIGDQQVKQLKAMVSAKNRYDVTEIIKAQVTVSHTLSSARFCTRNAIVQLSSCVRRGFVPSVEEWRGVRSLLDDMPAKLRTPLIDRMAKRIASCVSSQRPMARGVELDPEATDESLLELGRRAWGGEEFDVALDCYERLVKNPDPSVAIEANLACELIREVSEDIKSHFDFRIKSMEDCFARTCMKVSGYGGEHGLDELLNIVLKASIFSYTAAHYVDVAQSVRDLEEAKECKKVVDDYLELSGKCVASYSTALEKLLTKDDCVVDSETLRIWKHLLESLPDDMKGERWTRAFEALKTLFIKELTNDEEFTGALERRRDEIASEIDRLSGELKEKKKEYDSLGIFAIKKKDEVREQIQGREERLAILGKEDSTLEETMQEKAWADA